MCKWTLGFDKHSWCFGRQSLDDELNSFFDKLHLIWHLTEGACLPALCDASLAPSLFVVVVVCLPRHPRKPPVRLSTIFQSSLNLCFTDNIKGHCSLVRDLDDILHPWRWLPSVHLVVSKYVTMLRRHLIHIGFWHLSGLDTEMRCCSLSSETIQDWASRERR